MHWETFEKIKSMVNSRIFRNLDGSGGMHRIAAPSRLTCHQHIWPRRIYLYLSEKKSIRKFDTPATIMVAEIKAIERSYKQARLRHKVCLDIGEKSSRSRQLQPPGGMDWSTSWNRTDARSLAFYAIRGRLLYPWLLYMARDSLATMKRSNTCIRAGGGASLSSGTGMIIFSDS